MLVRVWLIYKSEQFKDWGFTEVAKPKFSAAKDVTGQQIIAFQLYLLLIILFVL